ncbi:MAG: rod shape-determining protein MreD [Bacteroidota bacterium]
MSNRTHYIWSAAVALVLLLVQTVFIPFFAVDGYMPDILILWLVFVAVRRGQIEATISGFLVGLLQDIIATRFFGLAALAKTIAAFCAGYFFNDNMIEQTLGSYRYIMIAAVTSFIHDLILFAILFQGSEGSVLFLTFKSSVAATIYTSLFCILPMFIFSRKYRTSWVQ